MGNYSSSDREGGEIKRKKKTEEIDTGIEGDSPNKKKEEDKEEGDNSSNNTDQNRELKVESTEELTKESSELGESKSKSLTSPSTSAPIEILKERGSTGKIISAESYQILDILPKKVSSDPQNELDLHIEHQISEKFDLCFINKSPNQNSVKN